MKMILLRNIITILILLYVLCVPARADENIINWMTINYPPAYILNGPQKNTGINDIAMHIMIRDLTDYAHKIIEDVSIPRMISFWENNDIYCSPGLAIMENYFPNTISSNPILVIPPSGIIIHKTDINKFQRNSDGINLESTFKNLGLKAGIMKGGQYGKNVDALIHKHQTQKNIIQRIGIDQHALLKMLLINHVDYLIDYPVSYYINLKKLSPDDQDKLIFVPLAEAGDINFIRAVCNDIPESRILMDSLNQVLETDHYKLPVIERNLDFLPAEVREKYRKLNMKVIGVE